MNDFNLNELPPEDAAAGAEPPPVPERPAAVPAPDWRPGVRWRDFQIIEPAWAPDSFFADNVASMERVVIRYSRVTEATEWRRGAWERLQQLTDLALVPVVDAFEEEGWRYEISGVPAPTNLREWISAHAAGALEIEAVVRQIAPVLHALHREGVVHLNVRPESIYVDESTQGLTLILGGLHAATLYTQPQLTLADVDPFYAPPEAAGLAYHQPGTRLCAWDWWSLGRVLQEAVLGKHVLGLLLARDVSRITPELRERAEQLLLEKAPPGIRAGAVEEMPDMSTATTSLLRGLLSGSIEARWRGEMVERWLRHESVKDYYDQPRTARMWSWRGQVLTIPEAADFFTQEEHWEDGEVNLFHADDPDTLAHFLHDSSAHRPELQRLEAAFELSELPAWGPVPPAARRPAVAAAAWLALAATGGLAQLRICGVIADSVGLQQLLGRPSLMEAGAVVQALLAAPFIKFVETYDPAAARLLTTLATVAGAAERLITAHGWADPHEDGVQTRLLAVALLPAGTLRKRVEQMRTRFAVHRDPELTRLLAQPTHASAELVVLVFTGESARHDYVTHEQWRREQLEALHDRGERMVRTLFWLSLRRVLRVGRPIGEPWPVFAAAAVVLAAVPGIALRSPTAGAGIAAALLAARVWLSWWVRQMVRKCDPAAGAWTWHDGLPRCERELARFAPDPGSSIAGLRHQYHQIRREMGRLATAAHPARPVAEPWWWELWAGLAVPLALALFSLLPVWLEPGRRPEPGGSAAATAKPAATAAAPKLIVPPAAAGRDPAELIASGEYELVDDGFGRGLRGPLQPWTLHAPPAPAPLTIAARARSSGEQAAFALVSSTLLLRPYARKAVNVFLAVRVPTTRGFGVMVFNTQERKLDSREVLLLGEPPVDRTWYRLGSRHVLYLAVPASLLPEISLALPGGLGGDGPSP